MSSPLPSHCQAKMVRYVVNYFLEHGVYPSSREAQAAFDFKSQTAVLCNWNALVRKGIFTRGGGLQQARSCQPVWQKVIEFALYIWPIHELKCYLIQTSGEDDESQTNDVYYLPHPILVQLQLLQQGVTPSFLRYEPTTEDHDIRSTVPHPQGSDLDSGS